MNITMVEEENIASDVEGLGSPAEQRRPKCRRTLVGLMPVYCVPVALYIPNNTKSNQRVGLMPVYCVTELLSHYCVDKQLELKEGGNTLHRYTSYLGNLDTIHSGGLLLSSRCLRCQLTYLLLRTVYVIH